MSAPSARGSSDLTRLLAAAALRSTATGLAGVELGACLKAAGVTPGQTGWVITSGLLGAALAAVLATFLADRHGRVRFVTGVALLGSAGALLFAASTTPITAALAAFIGMLNGMGRDRGAALIVEQAMLPGVVPAERRTRALAFYNVAQDMGHALGALLAGIPAALALFSVAPRQGHQAAFGVYALILLAGPLIYRGLTPAVEEGRAARFHVSRASRGVLARLTALFALDGLGGGFLTTALLSYFFFDRFGATGPQVAVLFAAARLLNALSHFGAAWLARRIGLVRTMVFTHIPSSFLLAAVGLVTDFRLAAVLFLLRESLVEMDVPTRQSYVLAVVRPEERTAASGMTNLVRMAMWAVAPAIAGVTMARWNPGAPLLLGAGLKVTYDILLYAAFRSVKPPEERRGRQA